MRLLLRCIAILLAAATAALAAAADRPSGQTATSDALSALHYKAVLIAGDPGSAAFDNATAAMWDRLVAGRVAPAAIQRLSAARAVVAQDGVRSSGLGHVVSAIEHMHPGAGEGCLVFATSHGAYEDGLALVPSRSFLTPAALDDALAVGCGDAPTVVIISACFSGSFTRPPMARANRIILTAARRDRPSFGCGAGFQYTVYDRCLLQAMDHSTDWRSAYITIEDCVARRENELHFRPSEPQAYFGDAVHGMPVPGPPRRDAAGG